MSFTEQHSFEDNWYTPPNTFGDLSPYQGNFLDDPLDINGSPTPDYEYSYRAEPTRGRFAKIAVNATAGLALLASAGWTVSAEIAEDNLAPSRAPEQAREHILPAGTKVDEKGVKQAEEHADPVAIDRTRTAFEAYYNNDKARLKQLAREQGYKSGWVAPGYAEKIDAASTAEEVESAVTGVTNGLLDFNVVTDISEIDPETTPEGIYTPVELNDAKALAKVTLDTANKFDSHLLRPHGFDKLDVMVVGSITRPKSTPAAYYAEGLKYPQQMKDVLKLKDIPALLALSPEYDEDNYDEMLAHEFTHGIAFNALHEDENIEDQIAALNPKGVAYQGQNYLNSPTSLNGNRFAVKPYANFSEREDLPVHAENLFEGEPLSQAEDTVQEKETLILLELETAFPGATSDILSRMPDVTPLPRDTTVADTIHDLNRHVSPYNWAVSAGSLLTIAASGAAWVNRRRKDRI